MLRLLAVLALLAAPPTVTITAKPPATAGRPWTATLAVRGAPNALVTARNGSTKLRATARRVSGTRHRVRLTFPRAGTWALTARAGNRTFRLGRIVVAAAELQLRRVSTIAREADGSLLLVEQERRRVLRVDPTTGRTSVVVSGLSNPFGVAVAPDGSFVVTDVAAVLRFAPGESTGRELTRFPPGVETGPVAIDRSGNALLATSEDEIVRVAPDGSRTVVDRDVRSVHGLGLAPDGSLLVGDTDNDRVVRLAPDGTRSVFAAPIDNPGGLDVAADGTVYVIQYFVGRVARIDAGGIATAVQDLPSPVDVAVAPEGLYVLDGELNQLHRVAGGFRQRIRLLAP